jgi:hypothetical protein
VCMWEKENDNEKNVSQIQRRHRSFQRETHSFVPFSFLAFFVGGPTLGLGVSGSRLSMALLLLFSSTRTVESIPSVMVRKLLRKSQVLFG